MPHTDSPPWVKAHVARSIDLWRACAAQNLPVARHYARPEQRKREHAYEESVGTVERTLKATPPTRSARLAAQERVMAVFGRFASVALGLQDDAVHIITNDFLPVGAELARWAQQFDPHLGKIEIVQACRNAWTACGLQPLLGRSTQLTPSILAYSLMYPYSDNYIDDKNIPSEAKSRFSERFRERLRGETPSPGSDREAALWALVDLVEEEYPRFIYPDVYNSLLAIHSAQERSVAQLRNGGSSSDAEVLEISCNKGGTSVLADAFLAAGTLNDAEARFAFDWGVLLQLGDDLQDLRDDMRRGSATLFTRAVGRGQPLDGLVRQLLVFSERVGAGMNHLPHATPTLRSLLKMSWRSLIVEAVADACEFFSGGFLKELERNSPFRLRFLRSRHDRLRKRNGFFAALFDVVVEPHEEANPRLPVPNYRPACVPQVSLPGSAATGLRRWGGQRPGNRVQLNDYR